MDKLTIAERVATLARIQTDASKDAADSSLAWRFGETESDKNSTQARTALRRAEAELKDALASRDSEADSPAARADFAGKVLGDEAVARKDLVALKTRSFEIDAAQKQVAVDYLRIMREQTEEANKKLMLATREEQLRLAAMAHTIRDRRVTSAEFYGLSAETRKAMVEFLPGEAPRRLNNAADKAYKEGIDLAEEKVRLASAIKEISGGLEKLEARILSATGDNGALDPLPRASDGPLAPNVPPPNTRDTSPTVSLSIGQVNVQLGQQVERIISAYVDRNLAAMEERLARQFPRPALPNSQGVTE